MSLAIPIRLEKKGLASLPLPSFEKISLFSIKNCLFSGNEASNLVRLVICSSTSTCEKSGFIVISSVNELSNINFASLPNSKLFPEDLSSKFLKEIVLIYGIIDFFDFDFTKGFSKYI